MFPLSHQSFMSRVKEVAHLIFFNLILSSPRDLRVKRTRTKARRGEPRRSNTDLLRPKRLNGNGASLCGAVWGRAERIYLHALRGG